MRLFFLLFLFASLIPQQQQAQGLSANRTLPTKIADVLAQFPADNTDQLNRNIEQLKDLKAEGLTALVNGLAGPGEGDNTSREYAIQAFTDYASKTGNEADRKIAVQAYCAALQQSKYDVNKDFIISQFQLIGKDDAVACLVPYLKSEYLVSRTAQTLALINTPQATDELMKALADNNASAPVIEALGYIRHQPAAGAIETILKSASDENIKKVCIYALARIGAPSSASLLAEAAAKAGYDFDNGKATTSYFTYLERLSETGNNSLAAKLTAKLKKKVRNSDQIQTKVALLGLLVKQQDDNGMSLLYNAMKDKDLQYRGAALSFAQPLQKNSSLEPWLKMLPKLSKEAKAQLITYLGNTGNDKILPQLQGFLGNEDNGIRAAAIQATAKLGSTAVIPSLLEVLKKGNPEDGNAVKSALLKMKTDNIGPYLISALGSMPANGKAALLEVLGARHDAAGADAVFSNFASADAAVQKAAREALPFVVEQKDLPRIFSLLKTVPLSDAGFVQDAAIRASSSIKDTTARTGMIRKAMNEAGADRQYIFFPILASVGGPEALSTIEKAFAGANDKEKTAIVEALSKTSDLQSATLLLKILQDPKNTAFRSKAVDGLLKIIHNASFTPDQNVLLLQDIMADADVKQKKKILGEAASNKIFPSLVFAGRFIDDPALQDNAAEAIFNIGLSNTAFTGDLVRNLLTKASAKLKGGDAEYQQKAIKKRLDDMPAGEGFVSMFNEKDLTGWKGLVANPIKRAEMTPKELAAAQKKADAKVPEGWEAKDGMLIFKGHGDNLATVKQYGDFEMFVDWKITPEGDAGIYLRGTPQVQIWDTSRRNVGAQVGSGGLYNNQKHMSKPLTVADNEIGQWNNFHIIMKGEKVTVYLNGILVTDNVVLENYWNRNQSIFPTEQIELQAHGTYVAYRNLYIRELGNEGGKYTLTKQEVEDGYKILFDGSNLDQWTGDKKSYVIENNAIVVKAAEGGHGNLFTNDEYGNFIFRFEFQLTPGANNGLGIRAPLEGDAAYAGIELQILDNEAEMYKNLAPYQYHGSAYGILPAKRGFLKPTGEWNKQEVIVNGTKIKVILNGEIILDGDVKQARDHGAPDKQKHPGLQRTKGHIGFLGHGSLVKFRNIRIKTL